MTNREKLLLSALLLAAGGATYLGWTAAQQRARAAELDDRLARAYREREDLVRALAAAQKESRDLETTLAKAGKVLDALAQRTSPSSDPTLEKEVRGWVGRLSALRALLVRQPEQAIPEMRFLREDDWMKVAAEADLTTPEGARKALAALRTEAKSAWAPRLAAALQKYRTAYEDPPPTDLRQLAAYFTSPSETAPLTRYEIVVGAVPLWGQSRVLVAEKAVADPEYDAFLVLHENGGVSFASYDPLWAPLRQAGERFVRDHPGERPASVEQLLPYLSPELADKVQRRAAAAKR